MQFLFPPGTFPEIFPSDQQVAYLAENYFVIPANDDATKSVEVILDACCAAMQEGLEERKAEKVDMEAAGEAPANKGKKKATKARLDKSDEEAINAAKTAAFMKEEEA
mgnify:FL=1